LFSLWFIVVFCIVMVVVALDLIYLLFLFLLSRNKLFFRSTGALLVQ